MTTSEFHETSLGLVLAVVQVPSTGLPVYGIRYPARLRRVALLWPSLMPFAAQWWPPLNASPACWGLFWIQVRIKSKGKLPLLLLDQDSDNHHAVTREATRALHSALYL